MLKDKGGGAHLPLLGMPATDPRAVRDRRSSGAVLVLACAGKRTYRGIIEGWGFSPAAAGSTVQRAFRP